MPPYDFGTTSDCEMGMHVRFVTGFNLTCLKKKEEEQDQRAVQLSKFKKIQF